MEVPAVGLPSLKNLEFFSKFQDLDKIVNSEVKILKFLTIIPGLVKTRLKSQLRVFYQNVKKNLGKRSTCYRFFFLCV